jgi:hypothetical protein
MQRSRGKTSRTILWIRWCWIALALLGLSMSGCARLDLRGPKVKDDELSTMARSFRPKDPSTESWAASNKAAQIESDFGVSASRP